MKGPTLFTERLHLRPMGPDDAAAVARLNSDAEVMRFLGGPRDASASNAFLADAVDQWRSWGYGRFTALSRETGLFLGWVSLFHGHAIYPDDAVIGWRFHREFWGQGLASEAAGRVLAFALDEAHLPRVIGIADVRNTPSIGVMARIGMRHVADHRVGERLLTVYSAP